MIDDTRFKQRDVGYFVNGGAAMDRIGLVHRWSDATVVGNLVFIAGHTAEKSLGQSVGSQTREVLALLEQTLVRSGSDKQNLAFVQIFLADISKIDEMNAVWDVWVPVGAAPARATVEARLAHSDYQIEVTAIAVRND